MAKSLVKDSGGNLEDALVSCREELKELQESLRTINRQEEPEIFNIYADHANLLQGIIKALEKLNAHPVDMNNLRPYAAKSVQTHDLNEEELEEADHIKKGKFTAWCKARGHDGPSKQCAKEAMASNSTSAHKMATFYTNVSK